MSDTPLNGPDADTQAVGPPWTEATTLRTAILAILVVSSMVGSWRYRSQLLQFVNRPGTKQILLLLFHGYWFSITVANEVVP